MSKQVGTPESKRQLTAQAFIQRITGGVAGSYISLGNVLKLKTDPGIKLADHLVADKGFKRVDAQLVQEAKWTYTLTLDEVSAQHLQLLLLATQGSDAVQGSGVAQTVSNPSGGVSPGYSYDLGKRGCTAHALTFGGSSKTEGTDFVLDYGSGMLTILESGSIANSTTLAGTLTYPAVTYQPFTPLATLTMNINFLINEFDQFNSAPRTTHSGTGQIRCTNPGEQDGEKVNEYEFTILATVKPTISERKD